MQLLSNIIQSQNRVHYHHRQKLVKNNFLSKQVCWFGEEVPQDGKLDFF